MASKVPSAALSADEPGTVALDEVLKQVLQDDQEGWEYEYSATETETYYLTIELSYPEFKDRATRAPHHSRGGYYKNWTDQSAGHPSAPSARPKDAFPGMQSDEDDEDEGDGDGDGDMRPEMEGAEIEDEDKDDQEADFDADGTPLDPMLQATTKSINAGNRTREKGKEVATEKTVDNDEDDEPKAHKDIQILELHSARPIISYRGRLFEGEWAEVIGTEAILAHRDKTNPLPALRNLADNIDILGASSSRIMTKEVEAKPKEAAADTLEAIKQEWNIRIPVGKDYKGERAQQISFLENLIALKKKRGDKDNVTVIATDGPGKNWNDRHGPDYKPRIRRKPVGAEEDDGEGAGERRRNRRKREAGRRRGRPGRPGKVAFAVDEREQPDLSTPTPANWDELSRPSATWNRPGAADDGEKVLAGEDVSMTDANDAISHG